MVSVRESRRTVFRRIGRRPHAEWPVYDSTLLYDRASLAGLESDVRIVSETWFSHDDHESIDQFICSFPLAYFLFDAYDCYTASIRYRMDTLFRVFVLKECHGWSPETALVQYLHRRPEPCEQLGLETVPDQSTLWRTWHQRFTADLCETVQNAARTILIKAQNADVAVPRELERSVPSRGDEAANQTWTIVPFSAKLRRSQSTSVESPSRRSRWSVEVAVRYTRTPTGAYRPISGCVRTRPPTKALAASYITQPGDGRR